MTTETQHEAGWIACRRCSGSGTVNWAGGTRSGPCFLCNGTGDGRIKNQNGFGPRRGHKGNGRVPVLPGDGSVPADTESDDTESDDSLPLPSVLPQHLTAAEHLAAALAGLQQSAPVDADMVRQIIRDEFAEEGNALGDLVTHTESRIAALLAGIPQRLVIEVGDHIGELPAMRHPLCDELLQYVAQNIPVYIVGPAGSGKTTAAHQTATALGLPYYLQGAMSGSHEILGFVDAHSRYQTTPWRQAYEFGGVMLLDEIDASDPAALLAANAGISNGHMSFPDRAEPVARHPDFRLIAAANTFGNGANRQYVGRSQLDGATLDRFAFIDWHYDETLERRIACNDDLTSFVQSVRKAVAKNNIRHIVSPRASIMGAKMLAAGMARQRVESAFIWKGLSDSDCARVRESL